MATIWVGPTSAGAANGTSWANRYGSLNAAEDRPVAAGDEVVVGPGVYRELLTCDVSGAAGSPITYTGDVTGQRTDGIGGIVRITGSDNDQTATRASCITATSKNYRTFTGFLCGETTATPISGASCTNWVITDVMAYAAGNYGSAIALSGAGSSTHTVQRCILFIKYINSYAINLASTLGSEIVNAAHTIENCMIFNGSTSAEQILLNRCGGVTIKNCLLTFGGIGISDSITHTVEQDNYVYDSIFFGLGTGVKAATSGDLIENYNTFYMNGVDRANVAVGANSNTYPPLFNPPILLDGFRFPWTFGELSKWSQIARIAGTGEATDDLFGITRPATSAKKSWGAIQATGAAKETTTTYGASAASLKLPDAGEQFLMRVPVTAVATTFAVKCYREADYAGTNPTLIVRQAGQADQVYTDVGAAAAWNTLSITCTPAADPEWVDLFVVSYNTAAAGNFDTFWDSVSVS